MNGDTARMCSATVHTSRTTEYVLLQPNPTQPNPTECRGEERRGRNLGCPEEALALLLPHLHYHRPVLRFSLQKGSLGGGDEEGQEREGTEGLDW
jgi:hypothetical protein